MDNPTQTPMADAAQTPSQPPAASEPQAVIAPTQNPAQAAPDLSSAPMANATPEFTVTPAVLPAVASTETPSTDAPTSDKSGDKKRILLVEDDDSLAQVYQTRLDAEGFTVQRVPNGEDALVSALNFKPDLILLDVMMPKVSGFDVLDILRNTPETAKVKVIMLTALGQDSDKERAASLGVDEYLVKSQVVIADVVDRIKQQLGINK